MEPAPAVRLTLGLVLELGAPFGQPLLGGLRVAEMERSDLVPAAVALGGLALLRECRHALELVRREDAPPVERHELLLDLLREPVEPLALGESSGAAVDALRQPEKVVLVAEAVAVVQLPPLPRRQLAVRRLGEHAGVVHAVDVERLRDRHVIDPAGDLDPAAALESPPVSALRVAEIRPALVRVAGRILGRG